MKLLKNGSGILLAMIGLSAPRVWAQPNETPTTIANPPSLVPAPRPIGPKAQIEFDLKLLFNALNGLEKSKPTHYDFSFPLSISGGRVGFLASANGLIISLRSVAKANIASTDWRLNQ